MKPTAPLHVTLSDPPDPSGDTRSTWDALPARRREHALETLRTLVARRRVEHAHDSGVIELCDALDAAADALACPPDPSAPWVTRRHFPRSSGLVTVEDRRLPVTGKRVYRVRAELSETSLASAGELAERILLSAGLPVE